MAELVAYRCWIPGQADLGDGFTLATSASSARYLVALAAHEAGYLPKPSPTLVRCRRCPEHDRNPSLEKGRVSSTAHVQLGAAVVGQFPTRDSN